MTTKLAFNQLNTTPTIAKNTGATGDGVTDDSAAIRVWAALGGDLLLTAGTYLFDNSVTPLTEIPSNTRISLAPDATLKFTSHANAGILIDTKTDIEITGGFIEGLPGTTASSDGITIDDSTNIKVQGVDVSQFKGIGVSLEGCTGCTIAHNNLHNNSVYGVQDKSGTNNSIVHNLCNANGTTTSGSNTIGRGLITWMCTDGDYSHNTCTDNTEYGLRAYSQTGDSIGTTGCKYIANHCEGNGTSGNIEFYIFNEGNLIKDCIFSLNTIILDGVASIIGMSVQGDEIEVSDNIIINSNDDQTGTAYQLFNCNDGIVDGGLVRGVATVFGFSGSSGFIPNNMTIRNVKAKSVASFIPSITDYGSGGKGHKIYNNEAVHGGGGTDNGIVLTAWAEGQFELQGNTMDGFNKGFTISNTAVNVRGNTAINSTTWGCEVTTATNDRVEMWGNAWDKGFPSSIVNMSTGRSETQGSRITSSNVSPASDSRLSVWEDGDFCHKTTVSVDGNSRIQLGWICTVGGSPGTWESVWASDSTWA